MRKALLAALSLLLVVPAFGELKHRMLRGEVVLRNNGGDLYNLVVLVDSFSRGQKRDGKVDHVFGIRSDESYGIVNERFVDAHVTVDAGRITIYSPVDDQAIVLAVPGEEQSDWLAPNTQLKTYVGHSMVANEGDFGLSLAPPRKGELQTNFTQSTDPGDPLGGSGSSACTSGGSGSSYCSTTCRQGSSLSCEVTCTGGYYACCSCDNIIGARCKCRPSGM